MTRTLRQFSVSSVVSTARQMLNGTKRRRTVVVEGDNDVRFFNQWYGDSDIVRFVSVGGKSNVMMVYSDYIKQQPMRDRRGMFFCVDIDWDLIHEKPLPSKDDFLCNSFCLNSLTHYNNDLEGFLVNTGAIKKVLSSYDIDVSDGFLDCIISKIEKASRCIGKYRAADEVTQKRLRLYSSVLNGLSATEFFDAKSFTINETELLRSMPNWSNYPLHIDDLVADATYLDKQFVKPFSLSNGHDITELLSVYIEANSKVRGLTKDKIEKELRLGCELADFKSTPMYEKMVSEYLIHA